MPAQYAWSPHPCEGAVCLCRGLSAPLRDERQRAGTGGVSQRKRSRLAFGGGRFGRVPLRGMTSRADRLGGWAVTKGSRRAVKPTVPAQPPCDGPACRKGTPLTGTTTAPRRRATAALREKQE
jgi:hypothetical protein